MSDETPQSPPPPPGSQPRDTGGPSGGSGDSRTWAMAAHLSAFLGAWFALAFVGPLVVWLLKRDQDPYVEYHAKEALNFNLTFLIALVISFLLAFLLIGIPILIALGIGWIILTVVAAVRANNGDRYRYPLTIRFIS